jgi:hypothetical protein
VKHKRKLLAVGCPRSGSQFLVGVLRNCGVKVGHEMFKPDGTIGMFFAVEDCYYPGKHWTTDDEQPIEDESRQHRSDYEFEQVWHYIRDPRKVIPSVASRFLNPQVWPWQERHTGISCGLYPKKLRAMRFWVAWNELIEKNEDIAFRLRVEAIDDHWDEIKRRLGIDPDKAMPDVARDTGTLEKGPNRIRPMCWDEMKSLDEETTEKIQIMAERYGYNTQEAL